MMDGKRNEERIRGAHQLKIVLLGNGTTGKTSIVTRFSQNHFGKCYQQTLGLDFFMKRITMPGDVDATLIVWDIGGQTMGGGMLDNYVYGADVILFVYDITNYASFEDMEEWLDSVKRIITKQGFQKPHMGLVGNKKDMEHRRLVGKERHIKFCKEHGMSSYFVSAKTDDLINTMFLCVTAQVLGIKLSGRDLEKASTVVRAEIIQYNTDQGKEEDSKRTKSSICVLQ